MCGADTGGQALGYGGRGLPPRVRSRQRVRPACASRERITSACAEQTGGDQQHQRPRRDYLRVCGADGLDADGFVVHAGLPPRVRSRRCRNNRAWSRRRITSACAEQTRYPCTNPFMVRDYLRVCGADFLGCHWSPPFLGLPPRVRSRPRRGYRQHVGRGITSACAEQTTAPKAMTGTPRDYLRVCGADLVVFGVYGDDGGLPPRVRSRQPVLTGREASRGITSACAEQTQSSAQPPSSGGDYLRVCGADGYLGRFTGRGTGLPPRVRSRQPPLVRLRTVRRITSACAEQTFLCERGHFHLRDYLRVCGADTVMLASAGAESGLPPRVRSRRIRRRA